MQQTSLIKTLYQIGVFQFGEFQLKSGQTSTIYLNLRKIISYPQVLRDIADAMWTYAKDLEFDLICGVPYTALPIATCLSLDHNIPMVMRRKEKKDYGTKQLIEGVFQDNQRCIIIEDVITSGASILETAKDLEAAGLSIKHLIALIDREQGGRKTLETNYQLFTVLTVTDILTTLLSTSLATPEEANIIQAHLTSRSI
ncbi:MAG: orotate phosphoribosyltransferase [Gammaproteobacteria bacterium]